LIGLIEGRRKGKEEHVMVEPELVVRTSCGATRAVQV